MDRPLQAHEHIDDLMYQGLRIIQSDAGFKFGMDAVLLADFARAHHGRALDLCSGTGIVALLLAGRNAHVHITALELQPDMAELSRASVALNALEARIDVLQGDVRDHKLLLPMGQFELVTVNPPYFPLVGGPEGADEQQNAARHEAHGTLCDVAACAAYALKYGGKLAMIIRADRAVDAMCALRTHAIEPKRARLVAPKENARPNLLLLEGVRGGKPTLHWESPLTVYDETGAYTPELRRIYHLEEGAD